MRTLDKKRLKEKLTYLSDEKMQEVDEALDISLGLHDEVKTQNT
ncbi:type II toxin-antitoxin system PemK/MazF family toxin [Enterococcus faecalis]